MKLYELIHSHNWGSIKKEFLEIYPDQRKNIPGYRLAYSELENISELLASEMTISIRNVEDEHGNYKDVYGILLDDPVAYALDFIDWRKVLSMEISEEILEKYSKSEILVHVMYEMTFYGYDNESVRKEGRKVLELSSSDD